MLIFSDLPEILIVKADLIRKIVICKLFFKQKCNTSTLKIFTGKYVEAFGLHKLIFVLL